MASLLQRLFGKGRTRTADDSGEAFAARFHRFKLFLSAYLEAYSEMMNFEERLGQVLPFGMPFLRMTTARLTVSTMQCVLQLNTLGMGRFDKLNAPFASLRDSMQAILDQGAPQIDGPLLVPYSEAGEQHKNCISPSLSKLEAIRQHHPELLPRGFIITGAAWWQYFNNPEMHSEVDRIMVISQEDSGSYGEASATIRERISSSFPLPEELEQMVRHTLAKDFPDLEGPESSLLVRCMPVRPEHAALVMPEQILTPVSADAVIKAIRSAMAMAYRTRAMLYRLKLGIRDRAMPLCVSLTLIPAVHARGSAHRKLETLNPEEIFLHIRRSFVTPEAWPLQASVEGATLPPDTATQVEHDVRAALECLADAPVPGNRHEVFWVASEDGKTYVHGVNALPDPQERPDIIRQTGILAPSIGHVTAGNGETGKEQQSISTLPALDDMPDIVGGRSTYPGVAEGKAMLVRNFADALAFPLGGVLVLQQANPRWSFLLDFARAAIAGDGTGNGMFARTARRYGRPTILRQPEAFTNLTTGMSLRLRSGWDRPPRITVLNTDEQDESTPVWLPSSDIADMARKLAPLVASLTLPDSDDVDFRAENCKTIHDILSYCQVQAVQEMFHSGVNAKARSAPAKQLVCDVPKQFWIINLDDGFTGEVNGPVVHLEQIQSLPMLSLWEGFTAKPWDGPPQLDAKGFLSVLFEATVNPNLDPASQSTQYTEKNIFLIAQRFCSMRCRFGFHYLSMDCLLGERERERFIIFQFKGGAANLARRIRRVHFVAEILAQFDFATEIVGDTLTARLEKGSETEFLSSLRVLGYLVMHTRQLDMIMGDETALAAKRFAMMEDMLALASTPGGQSPGSGGVPG